MEPHPAQETVEKYKKTIKQDSNKDLISDKIIEQNHLENKSKAFEITMSKIDPLQNQSLEHFEIDKVKI